MTEMKLEPAAILKVLSMNDPRPECWRRNLCRGVRGGNQVTEWSSVPERRGLCR
jgi:hypothetical protein